VSDTRWKTDDYFVSPWNFEPEAREGTSLPAKVEFHDVTLRDGEQQAGVELNADEKVAIAEKLAEAGVQRIEAGLPAVSPQDAEAVKRIAAAGLPSRVFAFSRCMVDDVKRALDCGVEQIVMEVPSSEHIIEYAYRWEYERAIELTVESTKFAHENGLWVSFFPIDSTRADITAFLDMIERIAREGHMDSLTLVDTFGVLNPQAASFLARKCASGWTCRSRRTSTWTSRSASPTRWPPSPRASRPPRCRCRASASGRATRRWRTRRCLWSCCTTSTPASTSRSSTGSRSSSARRRA
jgi:hypothetical protein